MVPKLAFAVVRMRPASTSAATSASSAPCSAMSGVVKRERANIISQCSEMHLVFSGIASSSFMSSITASWPWGFKLSMICA